MCTLECELYTNTDIVAYNIAEEDRIAKFWNIIIEKDSDTSYWIFLNQECFTKEEAIKVAKSVHIS